MGGASWRKTAEDVKANHIVRNGGDQLRTYAAVVPFSEDLFMLRQMKENWVSGEILRLDECGGRELCPHLVAGSWKTADWQRISSDS